MQVPHVGLDAARESVKDKVKSIGYEPKDMSLLGPKEGKHDDEEHFGGNTFAGGVSIDLLTDSYVENSHLNSVDRRKRYSWSWRTWRIQASV